MITWIRRKLAWACENPPFWCNLLFPVVVVLVTFVFPAPNASDFRIRTAGGLLQLIGVATVGWDLVTTASQFRKDRMVSDTLAWLKRGILGSPLVMKAEGAAFGLAGGNARFKVRTQTDPSAPLEERIAKIEALVGQIDADLGRAYKEIDSRSAELREQINAEASKLDLKHAELSASLASAVAGNYAKLAFGAVWLAVGVVLATWAPEIAKTVAGRFLAEVWPVM